MPEFNKSRGFKMKGFSTHQTTSPLKGKKAKAASAEAAAGMQESAAAQMEKFKSSVKSGGTNLVSPMKLPIGAIVGETLKEGGKAALKEGGKAALKETGKAALKETTKAVAKETTKKVAGDVVKKTLKQKVTEGAKKAGGKALASGAEAAGGAVVGAVANKLTKKKDVPERKSADMSGFNSQQYGTPMRKAGCVEGDPGCGGNFKVNKRGTVVSRAVSKAGKWVGRGVKNATDDLKKAARKRKAKRTINKAYRKAKKNDKFEGSHKTVRYL